jgi:hypothetical protein
MISAVAACSATAVVMVQAIASPTTANSAIKPTTSERAITRMINTPLSKNGIKQDLPTTSGRPELRRTSPEAAAQLDFAPTTAKR